MENLTNKNFEDKVLSRERPAIVKFFTPSCSNCQKFAPIFETTASANEKTADFFRLNGEDYLSVAKKYTVLVVPTLLFFRHGILVKKMTGIQTQKKIEKVIGTIASYSEEDSKANEYKSFFQKIFGK
ncbi:MAG: thioredoxin [Bacteroidetes bacterium]|nr:MAG: thioredoxin [Bacteroidota bacterium]